MVNPNHFQIGPRVTLFTSIVNKHLQI